MQNLINTKSKLLLLGLIILDITFLILYLSIKGPWFDLDWEMNIPTAYQALKLLLAGITGIFLIKVNKSRIEQFSWGFLSLILVYLSFDEWFQLHEKISYITDTILLNTVGRVSFSAWIVAFTPVIIVAIFGFYKIYTEVISTPKYNQRYLRGVFLAAFCVIAMVPVVEVLGTIGWDFYTEVNKTWIVIEEGMEMIGISLMFAGLAEVYRINTQKDSSKS